MYLGRFMLINIDEFDQVSMNQQGFLKHLLQKPVANLRKPYGSSIQEMRRYASFLSLIHILVTTSTLINCHAFIRL